MAKKRAKSYGIYKVEEIAEQVVACGNGLKVALKFHPTDKEMVKAVRITSPTGVETSIDAAELIQAAMAVSAVDMTKKYVCGFHGSFIAGKNLRQPPQCPHCLGGMIQAARDQGGELDNEDA